MRYVIFSSYGNDSIALIQWMHEHGHRDAYVAFSDTKWMSREWPARVKKGEALARSYGMTPITVDSEGFQEMVMRKAFFPRQQARACTELLKVKPAIAWLDGIDPNKELVCCAGIRREESAARAQWPEDVEESRAHSGRSAWFPLVRVLAAERDELILRAGFEPLAHRSRECYPCILGNRSDLRGLAAYRVAEIEALERKVSQARAKDCYMFRPARYGGAPGIQEVIKWAESERGAYRPQVHLPIYAQEAETVELAEVETKVDCDSGWCGM